MPFGPPAAAQRRADTAECPDMYTTRGRLTRGMGALAASLLVTLAGCAGNAASELGQPGTGKSTLAKRQITGAVATGARAIILGDTKPDYTLLTEHLGGQVIRIGRGLDRINPLDSGPLGQALRRMGGADAQALRWEVRSRRLSLLMALCTLVRESRITNAEEVVLGRAVDLLDARNPAARGPDFSQVTNASDASY